MTERSPWGLRLAGRPALAASRAYRDGLVEIQDEGSQLAAEFAGAQPGERVLDLCAGGGGKSLALAAAMQNRGHLVAADISPRRLAETARRARRAGVSIIDLVAADAGAGLAPGSFDRVLVDAPCSGSGAWRRDPDAKWRLSPARLEEYRTLEARLLDEAARLVRPGGRLVYMTCSVLASENDAQIDAFLARAAGFERVGDDLRLTPARHGSDGFFASLMERHA